MDIPLKNWCWLSLLALVSLIGCADYTRAVATSQKTSVSQSKQIARNATSRRTKTIAQQKADFRRWQNDPKVEEVERAARKVLRWKIYGAADCGKIFKWKGQTEILPEDQEIIESAAKLHKKRKPFFFTTEVQALREGFTIELPPTYTEDERTVFGTRDGEVYEFWLVVHLDREPWWHEYKHRKWKKPTIKKKGNDILFFDAGQKQQ
jgi:hypothetical protein